MLQDIPLWIMLPWLFTFGAVVGSFANVCIYRLPQRDRLLDQLKGLSWPPSSCTSCGKRILFKDNIPIYGWLRLLGKCRFCKSGISPRYPVIELLNGLMFVGLYLVEIPDHIRYQLSDSVLFHAYGPQTVNVILGNNWLYLRLFYHLVLFEALLVATFIDFDEMIIPDGVTLPAMAVGITGAFAIGQVHIVPVWFQNTAELQIWKTMLPEFLHSLMSGPDVPNWIISHPHLHGLAVSLCGFVVGGGIVWGVRLIGFWILRKEAMGFGDVVLMAMIGSFIGWQPVIVVFFLAPICALVVVILSLFFRRGSEIPFGPYLSLGTLLLVLGWKQIWPKVNERIFELGIIVPMLIVIVGVLLAVCLLFLQLIKKLLGFELYETEEYAEWTSADQLLHFSGEKVEKDQGNWKKDDWPGLSSGRGSFQLEQWKNRDS